MIPSNRILRQLLIRMALIAAVTTCIPPARAESQVAHSSGDWTVYTHLVSSRNSYYAVTWLDDPLLNGRPDARVVLTPGIGWGSTLADPSPLGVAYDHSSGQWLVFNQNGQSMQSGMSFNVIVDGPVFEHVTSASNTEFDWTRLDHPEINGREWARVVATPVFDGVHHDHMLGAVFTNAGNWAIQNLDSAPMPTGLRLNVMMVGSGFGFVHRISQQGMIASSLEFGPNGNPGAKLFVMPVFDSSSASISGIPVGVRYDGYKWELYSRNGTALQQGATYTVVHWTPPSIVGVRRTTRHLLVEITGEVQGAMSVFIDGRSYPWIPHRRKAGVLKVRDAGSLPMNVVRVGDTLGLLSRPFILE